MRESANLRYTWLAQQRIALQMKGSRVKRGMTYQAACRKAAAVVLASELYRTERCCNLSVWLAADIKHSSRRAKSMYFISGFFWDVVNGIPKTQNTPKTQQQSASMPNKVTSICCIAWLRPRLPHKARLLVARVGADCLTYNTAALHTLNWRLPVHQRQQRLSTHCLHAVYTLSTRCCWQQQSLKSGDLDCFACRVWIHTTQGCQQVTEPNSTSW